MLPIQATRPPQLADQRQGGSLVTEPVELISRVPAESNTKFVSCPTVTKVVAHVPAENNSGFVSNLSVTKCNLPCCAHQHLLLSASTSKLCQVLQEADPM